MSAWDANETNLAYLFSAVMILSAAANIGTNFLLVLLLSACAGLWIAIGRNRRRAGELRRIHITKLIHLYDTLETASGEKEDPIQWFN